MAEPQNYRMIVAYDGTGYSGFQSQPGRQTIQGALEKALGSATGSADRVAGAGRTDAGVHAVGLVVSYRSAWRHSPDELQRALNALLPGDVAVSGVERVAESFHARYSATSREYVYRIYQSTVRLPHLDRFAWRVSSGIDESRVKCASEMIVGEHDLRAFGTAAGGRSTVRRVMRAEWRREPQLPWGAPIWQFSIEANGFLRGMVRRVVGTLVRVSEGHLEPDDVRDIIRAGDPARAGPPAPARGLFFWEAHYAGE